MPVNSSPRPKARPTKAKTGYASPKLSSTRTRGGGGFLSGNTKGGNLGGNGGGSDRQPTNLNTRRAEKKAALQRETQQPDNSLLLSRRGQTRTGTGGKSNRLLPDTKANTAARTLQSFNGPSKKRTVLGQ